MISIKTHIPIFLFLVIVGCDDNETRKNVATQTLDKKTVSSKEASNGMVFIPGGDFMMGSDGEHAKATEGPAYWVKVSAFYMDKMEVTNKQFKEFVDATGYITVAERSIDWEEMKKQLPPGTPRPPDSFFLPGSLVFQSNPVSNLYDYTQWWAWVIGTNWKHPYGPDSNIEGKDDHPVVHIAFEDAQAYAEWAGKRLPTEAEWEYASRGGQKNQPFAWGDELTPNGKYLANFYQGRFPENNAIYDGYEKTAPVGSFHPNGYGLYDMIGNVWEWTSDWYRPDTHQLNKLATMTICKNPQGPDSSFDPMEPRTPKRVIKGGSYLCSEMYCSNYRPSARMATAYDSGQEHLGFRCVMDVEQNQ